VNSDNPQLTWFRNMAPYIKSHRNRTFVIYLGDGALDSRTLMSLVHDLALLQSLGIRLVLVHATRSAIETELDRRGIAGTLHRGIRVTDHSVLEIVRQVTAAQRVQLESLLSMGLPNSPMRGARLRVISGNFVTARPLGIVDGVDFMFTGAVRRIDAGGVMGALEDNAIVLLSPLGFSPTGEVFNLAADELATAAASSVGADKLIVIGRAEGLQQPSGELIRQCTVDEAEALDLTAPEQQSARDMACRACQQGVPRAHLISYTQDGALLAELFTHDGVGTLISHEDYEQVRRAGMDDIGGVIDLVQPLEESGVLVRRSRERLEQEIDRFRVLERDGRIIACAALYPFADTQSAEIACIATHPDYRGHGRGERLLQILCDEARTLGLERVFVLTTQTTHWFVEQGFREVGLDTLPDERQRLYNLQRNSKVLERLLET
jgi:amino-acid N-acetyltransferase